MKLNNNLTASLPVREQDEKWKRTRALPVPAFPRREPGEKQQRKKSTLATLLPMQKVQEGEASVAKETCRVHVIPHS